MKIALQDNRRYVLRFDKDEEVITGLAQFMQQQNIQACSFQGIGSCSRVELGYYNVNLKDYRKKPYLENLEIVTLAGSGAVTGEDSKPVIHAHGLFSRTDFTSEAGHVFSLTVSATCEIFLIKLDGKLERKNNPDFNLNLLV